VVVKMDRVFSRLGERLHSKYVRPAARVSTQTATIEKPTYDGHGVRKKASGCSISTSSVAIARSGGSGRLRQQRSMAAAASSLGVFRVKRMRVTYTSAKE
jgi:hypothetical protein